MANQEPTNIFEFNTATDPAVLRSHHGQYPDGDRYLYNVDNRDKAMQTVKLRNTGFIAISGKLGAKKANAANDNDHGPGCSFQLTFRQFEQDFSSI